MLTMQYISSSLLFGIDGKPLMDRNCKVTSNLSGLLYRTTNLIEAGIKPVYVFDGKPPVLKEIEIKRRMRSKEEALVKYDEALSKGDLKKQRCMHKLRLQ